LGTFKIRNSTKQNNKDLLKRGEGGAKEKKKKTNIWRNQGGKRGEEN